MDDPVENTKTAPVDVDEVVAAAMRSDPNLEYLVRGLIGAAHRRGWDAALDASTAMLDCLGENVSDAMAAVEELEYVAP